MAAFEPTMDPNPNPSASAAVPGPSTGGRRHARKRSASKTTLLRIAPTPNAARHATALAALVPALAYLATASSDGFWLDAGTFVAQGRDFGISHPPGHPLFGILASTAALLPLGSLPFRVALVSAMTVGVACAFFQRSARRTFDRLQLLPTLSLAISVGATWLVASTAGWWIQAVRPEVYGLQAALVLFIADRATALEARSPSRDLRPLYGAALALGLALANHHFLALLVLPATAPTLARALMTGGRRALVRAAAFTLLGLSTYAYLPLRATSSAVVRLGEPDTLSRFWWVVSARAFHKNQGSGAPGALSERLGDVGTRLALDLHPLTLVCALGGLYVLLRIRGARAIGLFWGLLLSVHVLARAWLGFVQHNPDASGYLMVAAGALSIMAAALVGVCLHAIGQRVPRIATVLAVVVMLVPLAYGWTEGRAVSLRRFADGQLFDDVLLHEVPPRSVLLAHDPQTVFRLYQSRALGERPDVQVVPMPLLSYPGMVSDLVEHEPSLRALLRGLLLDGTLASPPLESLASLRPVFVEMDPRVDPNVYGALVPAGHYHRVLADGATEADVADEEKVSAPRLDRLRRRLGDMPVAETRHRIVWQRFVHALFLAGIGQREAARAHLSAAAEISPEDPTLIALYRALETGEGPVDLAPFRFAEAVARPPKR